MQYRYESISIHSLSSQDLLREATEQAEQGGYPEAYRVWVGDHAEPAEAVHYTTLDLVAFAWGAPCDVYDATSIEDGLRQALEFEPVDWVQVEREEMANAPEVQE